MKKLLFIFLFMLFLASCGGGGDDGGGGSASGETSGKIDVGGHGLQIYCAGTSGGRPMILMDSGWGQDSGVWIGVQGYLGDYRSCGYNRAGYDPSDSGPEPRDSRQIATEMYNLLHNAGYYPPYVLVGHSFGGANIRMFAAMYPDEVAAMVFIDPAHEDYKTVDDAEIRRAESRGLASNIISELRNINGSLEQLRGTRLPDVPTVVLTSMKGRDQGWYNAHDQLVQQVSNGTHLVTTESNHNIHVENAQLVADAIRMAMP
jgi:pimeloyl-ACP methyl ester carboxylesterase